MAERAKVADAAHVHEAVMRAEEMRDEYLRHKGWRYVSFRATWLWEKQLDGRNMLVDGATAFGIQVHDDDTGQS